MAKFKLYLLNLTETNESNIRFTPSIMSEFYSPDVIANANIDTTFDNKYSNYCYTYGETLEIHSNAQKQLIFKMEKMILKGDEWIENPYSRMMLPGAQLSCIDSFDNQYLFTISTVKYSFKETNVIYDITCQDSFSHQLSTQNEGYEIVNDSSSQNFIGAKTIDFWADKIVNECYIPYTYLQLSQGLYKVKRNDQELLSTTILSDDIVIKVLKQPYNQKDYPEYYDLIPFSASGSANSVLINLGEQIDFNINTCEFSADQHSFQRYFWFEPKKHEETSGLIYSPYNSIKSFGLTHNGNSLTTILNVSGDNNNNKIVSLLPSVPEYFLQFFNSEEWDKLRYEPNIYTQVINHKLQTYTNTKYDDLRIWHGENDSHYMETYQQIQPSELPLDQIYSSTLDYTFYKHRTSNNKKFLYFPLVTDDNKTFYFPGYDNYSFQWDNLSSSIILKVNNDDCIFNSIDNTFQLCNITNETFYQYQLKGTIASPIDDVVITLLELPVKKLDNNSFVDTSLVLQWSADPEQSDTSVTNLGTVDKDHTRVSQGINKTIQLQGATATLNQTIRIKINDSWLQNEYILPQSVLNANGTTIYLRARGSYSYSHYSTSLPSGAPWPQVYRTDSYSTLYIDYSTDNQNWVEWKQLASYSTSSTSYYGYPEPSYFSWTVAIEKTYIKEAGFKLIGTYDNQPLDIDDPVSGSTEWTINNPPTFYLNTDVDIRYCDRQLTSYQTLVEKIITSDNLHDYTYKNVFNTAETTNMIFLKMLWTLQSEISVFDILSENIYLNWLRTPTQEEVEFAQIADQIPWLENKLIDFSYFAQHNLITEKQYSELQNTINNELRLTNGKLIFYTNAYYNALHYQTTTMANLLNALQGLAATYSAQVINAYEKQGSIGNLQQFDNSYKTIFYATDFLNSKHELLNYDTIYSDYVNKYISAQQRFLKNLYYFQKYFNENISIFKPNSAICEDTVTVTSSSRDYFYSFKQQNNIWQVVSSNFSWLDEFETPLINIYKKENSTSAYSPVQIVDALNYRTFDYALIDAEENYAEIENNISDYSNVYCKAWKVDLFDLSEDTIASYSQIQWVNSPDNNISDEVTDRLYRYWTFVVYNNEYYVYPIVPWYDEEVPSILYDLNDPESSVHIDILANTYVFIPVAITQIQESYLWLQALHQSEYSRFMDLANGEKPELDNWYIRETPLYNSVNKLVIPALWEEDDHKQEFKNLWLTPCYWTYESGQSLISDVTSNRRYYLNNLPLTSLFIKTHQYKIDNSKITIVNAKNQSFTEWYTSTFNKTKDAKINAITLTEWSNPGNPYNYITYQEIPFISYQNYREYAHQPYPRKSWLSKINPLALIGKACVFGWATTLTGLAINEVATVDEREGESYYYDNCNYKGTSYTHPGEIIYLTELSESCLEKYSNVRSYTKYYSTQTWVEDAVTSTYTDGTTVNGDDTVQALNTWKIQSMDINTHTLTPEPSCNYISFYKFCHHTYGTLFKYIEAGNRQKYTNESTSLTLDAQELLFKDIRCVLLYHDDVLNTQDTYYLIPTGCNTIPYVPFDIAHLESWNENQLELYVNKFDANQYVNTPAYLKEICEIDNKLVGVSKEYYSFSKIACYPWLNVAEQLVIKNDISIEQYLKENYDSVSYVTTEDYPYYKVQIDNRIYECVVVREESYSKESFNIGHFTNYYNLYNVNTNKQFKWVDVAFATRGYYYHKNEDEGFVSASQLSSFDNSKHYYKNGQRYYTLAQIKPLNQFYYIDNTQYIELNLSADKTQFNNLELYKYRAIYNDDEPTTIKSLEYDSTVNVDVTIPDAESKRTISGWTVSFDDFDLNFKTKTIRQLANVTNGQFWYDYHNTTEYPTLFEYAAAIETRLQEYWSSAYNASLFCEYFIPSTWQPSKNGTKNYFTDQLYSIDEDTITLSNNLPQISILQDENGVIQLPSYSFHYNSSITTMQNGTYALDVISNNEVLLGLKQTFGNDFWNNFTAEDLNYTTTYFIGVGGWIKPNINFEQTLAKYNKFSGIYQMIIWYLQEHFIDKPLTNYELYKNKHNLIWKELYKKYPSVLIEGRYENTTATNSIDLMTMAKYAFKDLSRPERQYNISVINNLKDFINYQGQELRIGDPIQVASREFYNQFDDIRVSLDQLLFISDIKYNLREDNNISITVNSIKYQDKLIKRLVKLIK